MTIVDAHVHVWGGRSFMPDLIWDSWLDVWGHLRIPEEDRNKEFVENEVFSQWWDPKGDRLVAAMDAAGIDHAVIMPMDFGLACGEARISIEEKNEKLAEICRRHPGRLFACVGVDPRRDGSAALVRRAINEWNAVGVKLYPPTGFYPSDEVCDPVYEAAMDHGVPVAFHTGAVAYPLWSKYGRPLHLDEVAKRHPRMSIVMLHTGFHRSWTEEAIQVAIYNPNVYCEMAGWQEWEWGAANLLHSSFTCSSASGPIGFCSGPIGPEPESGSRKGRGSRPCGVSPTAESQEFLPPISTRSWGKMPYASFVSTVRCGDNQGAFQQGGHVTGIERPSREQCSAVLQGYRSAWERQDPVMMSELFDPKGVLIDPRFAPFEGPDAVFTWYRKALGHFVDPEVEYVRTAVDPPAAMAEWVSRLSRDGTRYVFHGVSVFEVGADGKVLVQRDYFDTGESGETSEA